jgi:hypothetical protein
LKISLHAIRFDAAEEIANIHAHDHRLARMGQGIDGDGIALFKARGRWMAA